MTCYTPNVGELADIGSRGALTGTPHLRHELSPYPFHGRWKPYRHASLGLRYLTNDAFLLPMSEGKLLGRAAPERCTFPMGKRIGEHPLKNNYILIDFENVRPVNLEILNGLTFTLIVFVGASQNNVPFEFAAALQSLGEKANYRKVAGNGSNALDFHIAFYMGELAANDANAYFHVISRDKGFDPLIAHLRERKILARRHEDISEIPFVRISNAKSLDEKIDAIVANFSSRGQSRPSTVRTLASTVNALFMKTLDEKELNTLIAELQRRGHILVKNQSVSYGDAITAR